jgi:hypothetical protein
MTMPEAVEATAPVQVSREAAIAAAAAASAEEVVVEEGAPAVLTTEDVAGEKPAAPEAQGDREMVAPSIREFLRSQKPQEAVAKTGLEQEVHDLREALNGIAGGKPEELTGEQSILAKLEALETRFAGQEAKDTEAAEEEAYNNRVRSMREGTMANITAMADKFPGVIALEQQETAFNALVQRESDGIETSEIEIASEMEEGLRKVYETLHKVYSTVTPSKDQPASEPKVTLTPGLSGTEDTPDLDKMSIADRKEFLWNKHHPQS